MPEMTTVQFLPPTTAPAAATKPDPAAVFGKLVREVEAGQVLVSLAMTADETRRAALDSLALARDVLADALELVAPEGDADAGQWTRCLQCFAPLLNGLHPADSVCPA